MSELTPSVKKWLQKTIKDDFASEITSKLHREIDIESIVSDLTSTKDLKKILEATKVKLQSESLDPDEVPRSPLSFSELSDTWSPFKPQTDISLLLDNLSSSKPNHVRLGSYESLMECDFTNFNDEVFKSLLSALQQGLADPSRPVFESSLKVHAKLLLTSRAHEVYTNLLASYETEYFGKKLNESLPNLNIGVNFKLFLHEKLFRVLYLIVEYQKEVLKSMRTPDRASEEMIEQFLIFLSSQNSNNSVTKTLSTLNFISVLDPSATWSRKWMHSFATRKIFINALAKLPNLLEIILKLVAAGFENPPSLITFSTQTIFIFGETIETLTYFHGVNLLGQLCGTSNGRQVIAEVGTEMETPSAPDFCKRLIGCLNQCALSSTASRVVYSELRRALKSLLQPTFPVDNWLFHAALNPLIKGRGAGSGARIWGHTVDILMFMTDLQDGRAFLLEGRATSSGGKEMPPVEMVIIHCADLLRQPFAVMDVGLVVDIFKFMEKFYDTEEVGEGIKSLLGALEFFYNKIDKFSIGYENWTQQLDAGAKNLMIKLAVNPRGLEMLTEFPTVLEELVRGAINPLKHSWDSCETVCFISAAGFFHQARGIMRQLVPQTFSMLLEDICGNLEEREKFFEPWDQDNVKKFVHIVALLGLNTECYSIFALDSGDYNEEEYPRSFCELITHSMIEGSIYHELGLLVLEAMIWNLDILIHLMHTYDLQTKLLELQKNCRIEVAKYEEKTEDDSEFREDSNYLENEVREVHEVREVREVYDGYEIYRIESEVPEVDDTSEVPEVREVHEVYAVDQSAYLRHRILWNSYFIKHKLNWAVTDPERIKIFDSFPPEVDEDFSRDRRSSESESELNELLSECKPGFRDVSWASQIKKAHKNSPNPLKHATVINLLEQMEQAIPTVEWVDVFKWDEKSAYFWLPEEEIGFDLAIRFAEDHCVLEDPLKAKENLKEVFGKVHGFIQYEKDGKFRGFDWFLSTVFVICDGNVEKCKGFVKQLVRFPSAIYMWRTLGLVFDANNEQENATQFIIAQHIEAVVNQELPRINYSLKKEFGIKWWIVSDRLLTQIFWGILEWDEILNFISICLMNQPDYIVYYGVSLLQHCEPIIINDMIEKKSWPECLNLSEYKCHNYLGFMDRLAKRHRNKILPALTQRILNSEEVN
ncbi:protein broad-minded-like [Microplitis mediator]|uniref:protein broad-minded-like n=1 Tax=Microplitis mediator TaxID=375433 RepID=UPI002552EB8B|nr:protein broad-minded-like [Microplitis mediator]